MMRSRVRRSAVLGLCTLLLFTPAAAQKKKFTDAVERSRDAGRIIELLALVPEGDLPRELIDRAEAVGVFPRVEKEVMLFTHMTLGYGVISARSEGGWTRPAFYAFGGGGYGNPFASGDTYGVLLLFMTKDAVAAFEKGGVKLKGERKALAGPIGALGDAQRKEIEGAHVLAYAYYNGRLRGTTFGKSFWKSFALNPDNNINKPLYGMKGREVLAGKEANAARLPDGVDAFRAALQKYYGARPAQAPSS
jgi:SH3 domain-containing YSC84-like protein 1